MSESTDPRLSKNPDLAWRRVADELILVPIRGCTDDLSYVYSLNETAARIWELIDGQNGRADIQAAIEREFDVDAATAAADLTGFLDELLGIEAVREEPR